MFLVIKDTPYELQSDSQSPPLNTPLRRRSSWTVGPSLNQSCNQYLGSWEETGKGETGLDFIHQQIQWTNGSVFELTCKSRLHWGWLCQNMLLGPETDGKILHKTVHLWNYNSNTSHYLTNWKIFFLVLIVTFQYAVPPLLTQSSHDPLGFFVLYDSRRFTRISQAFWMAAPLRSEEAEAAVGLVLGTVLVLVSEMWIFEQGIPRTLLAT